VLVQNLSDRTMTVDVAARGAGVDVAGIGQRVVLRAGDRAELRFDAEPSVTGDATIQVIAASIETGGPADAAAATVPVLTPASVEAFATYGSVDTGVPVVVPLSSPAGVIPEFGGLDVTLTSTALHSLTDAVLYLHRYPFAGSEHLASRVLAVAALRDVLTAFAADGMPSPSELEDSTRSDIASLVARQNGDGGWPFWRTSGPSNPFVSMHVAHALQRARDRGFDVPSANLALAARYLSSMDRHLDGWPQRARQSANAYALYVRDRLGDAGAVTEARRLASAAPDRVGGELPVEAAGWLLHVLADDAASADVRGELMRTLMNRLVETAGSVTFAERYEDGEHLLLHSSRRTDAVVLEALIAAGADVDVVTRLAQSLLAHRTSGRWGGTQENAWVLLALDRYFRTYEATTPSFRARVWIDDRYAGGRAFEGRSTDREHVHIPMPDLLRADPDDLLIAREGAGRMYYRAGLRYAPADPRLPAAHRGFTVSRVYEAVDDAADVRQSDDGTWHVRAGARIRVRVTLLAPSVRYHAALVDPIPAGFEPLNAALQGTGFTDAPPPPPDRPGMAGIRPAPPWWSRWYEHHNLRDDRAEAFASLLRAGEYEYTYLVRATTPGTFVAPPPRAEMMYQPETFGRGQGSIVIVEEQP
jgi:alpha-2-macroglobulin